MKSKRSVSLNIKVFNYFLLFTVLLVALLWILQIGLLDRTYKLIRLNDVRKASSYVSTEISDGSYDQQELLDYSLDHSIAIAIIDTETSQVTMINDFGLRNVLGNNYLRELTNLLRMMGSETSKTFYLSGRAGGSNFNPTYNDRNYRDTTAVVDLSVIQKSSDNNQLLIVLGEIMAVDATRTTLRTQLILVTAAMIIIALLLSWFLSRRLARPIEEINRDTQIMATGNYDITFNGRGYKEIEELSETLNHTAVELGKADKMTRDLIANVSHDLRTPLTMISGYAEIMRDVPNENNPENVQVIINEANRLTSLVNNLLDMSKLESGAIEITRSDVNITEMVSHIYYSYQKMMENSGNRFVLDIDDDDIYVNADKTRLEQVFYNLINNALTHAGKNLTITLKCHLKGEVVRMEVADDGCGISAEDLPHIWDRYYKADKEHIQGKTGFGLGLSIVKTILELHGASYGVESEINKGTDFWFELPAAE